MAIRISRIKIKRAGPLNGDFEFQPGDLNLVYGHNETGKTYIVETMINLLFKTSKRAPAKWNLRKWDLGGKIIVSGLEDDPVPFTKTGKKLEQYWEEGSGLPGDLSRLLVVKAGETVLTEEEEDGVGRGILKNYLSGEGLLDKIAARISKILQVTTVQESLIHGAQKGEVKKRMEREDRLRSLNALLEAVEQEYASGEVYSLRQKKQTIEAEQKKLEKAKRHYAAQLYNLTQTKRREKDELPTEEELAKLEADIGIFDSKKTEAETKSETLERTGRYQRGLQVDRESPRLLLRDHKQTYRLRSKTDLDTYHVALLCGRAGHRLSWTQHPPRHLWHRGAGLLHPLLRGNQECACQIGREHGAGQSQGGFQKQVWFRVHQQGGARSATGETQGEPHPRHLSERRGG